ncbi:ubiquitin carboxyl-terminal hydrolase 8-like [Impatiens glandulifera]|uniref:ubiquitin carboxyl-terminal hydrolase 8-like n=1 Tax=Impatiens glandulifera TaxID=253017 RepID=UPI001FB15B2F|nr:ubiquitin carboxyl-terminal hydrolase 8-like [Impatiens glandulifera]
MEDTLFISDYDVNEHDHDWQPVDRRPSELHSSAAEQLYFVPYRWWNEARESLFCEVEGILYAALPSCKENKEIEISMRRQVGTRTAGAEEGVSDNSYALLSEWMFLRANKWHNDAKSVGSFGDSKEKMLDDLFSLKIRLSVLWDTNSLLVKICHKENEVSTFNKARNIFCARNSQLFIWDFSARTTQFFTNGTDNFSDSYVWKDEELHLDLLVYGYSYVTKLIEGRSEETSAKESMIADAPLNMDTAYSVSSYCGVNCGAPCIFNSEAHNLGLVGLNNLGNTCFMNSAIQCLAHTPELVDYFLGDFRKDINTTNPLGMSGELAFAFGNMLRKLWSPEAVTVDPKTFKSILGQFAPQFNGYNQHDSQEFLAFLLDGLHEDLNRVKCKPYIEVKDEGICTDDEVADEHWHNHLARNDSIIVAACQGQYRSTLVCPACKKKSITFDPFMYLSLPLPSTTTRTMTLTVVSEDRLPFPVTVVVPKYGVFKDLIQVAKETCRLRDDETLLFAEIYNNKVLQFLEDPFHSLELVRDEDQLVAYILPKDNDTSPLVVFMHKRVNTLPSSTLPLQGFGIPLVGRASDLSRGSDIHKLFLKLVNPFQMPIEDLSDVDDGNEVNASGDVEIEDVITPIEPDNVTEDSEWMNEEHSGHDFQYYWSEEKGFVARGPGKLINRQLPISDLPKTINVIVSWPDAMTELYDTVILDHLPQICKPGILTQPPPQESITLYECLEAFLMEEPLGLDDMWYCPNCKKRQQANKKLDLWRLPTILIIHLKRFHFTQYFKNKLETFVDFPIHNLDLSRFTVHKNGDGSNCYELYAVSNHYGSMGGGHYTAYVQHGRGRWYDFDDRYVSPMTEDQTKTSSAYVLFYRRV